MLTLVDDVFGTVLGVLVGVLLVGFLLIVILVWLYKKL
jgi:hypothetical protein